MLSESRYLWDTQLLLPWDMGHGHALLLLVPSDSDQDFHFWLSWFSGIHVWTGTILSAFLGFQVTDDSLMNFSVTMTVNKILIINLYLYIYLSNHLIGFLSLWSLTNTNIDSYFFSFSEKYLMHNSCIYLMYTF